MIKVLRKKKMELRLFYFPDTDRRQRIFYFSMILVGFVEFLI